MNLFGILLRKELKGFRNVRKSILGGIIGAVTILAIMAAFVYLFIGLTERFTTLKISRQILTLFIFVIFALSIILSLNKAANIMFSDKEILQPLPLDPYLVMLSKLSALFIYQLISTGAIALPIFIAFGITSGSGAVFYIKAIFCVIILAIAATAISALISPLFNRIKKFLLSHGPLFLILSLIFIFALFFLYKYILDIIIGLIRDRRLQFVFNSRTVDKIKSVAECLLFSNSLGKFLSGENLWAAFVCLVISAGALVGSFFLCERLLRRSNKDSSVKATAKATNKLRSVKGALIYKEINELVRTPGYMFSYLSIVLSLPALTYLTMGVLNEVVAQLLTTSLIAPFALLIIVLYSTVSNTFAGDAVSREGSKLSIVKTIPVSYKLQVGVKLLLSLGIAGVAIIITGVLVVASGMVTPIDGLIISIVALLSTAASIIGMINNDLGGVDSERNTASSVVKSFMFSIFIGAIACALATFFGDNLLFIYAFPLVLSVLYLVMVALRYVKSMERRIEAL